MRKIETIWNELESGAASTDRILVRRYSAGVTPNIFVGLKVQSGLKCLAIRVENQILDDLEFENTLRDIRLETEPNEQDKSKSYLLLTLTDDDLITVFAVLCEDLIEAFKDESAEDKLVSNLIDRVGHWQLLFEKFRGGGLSENQQRGLYGEIYFLKSLLESSLILDSVAVKSWVGPKMVPKDFQYSDWGVEVKTTTGRNHLRIKINNELQLDDSNLRVLYVHHLSLEEHEGGGQTLPELIAEVRSALLNEAQLRTDFNNNLVRVGYFDEQVEYYEHKGYLIRDIHSYRVNDSFPRLIEGHIPNGVGDVTYTIDAGLCSGFEEDFEQLIKDISDAG